LLRLAAGSVERLREIVVGLEIDPERMHGNLGAAQGVLLAESLMMSLAPKIGRAEAKHRVAAAVKLSQSQQRSLAEIAKTEPAIAGNLTAGELERALDARAYLGSADPMVDGVLAEAQQLLGSS
jgi:3-carboxy-cis,cis-muconate cycloisomerase